MSTHYDLIKGANGNYKSAINGNEFTITMILTDVDGADSPTQLWNALNHEDVPERGSSINEAALSTISPFLDDCWLRDIDANPLGDGEFEMVLYYQHGPLNQLLISAGSQISQIETTNGLNPGTGARDVPISLAYTYPSDYGGDDASAEQERLQGTTTSAQGGTVTIHVPEATRIYQLREEFDPNDLNYWYGGRLNLTLWKNGQPGEWLLASISGTNDNSGTALPWNNTWNFQRKIGGWDPEAIFSDQLTQEPVPDAVDGESIKTVTSYKRFEFNNFFGGL